MSDNQQVIKEREDVCYLLELLQESNMKNKILSEDLRVRENKNKKLEVSIIEIEKENKYLTSMLCSLSKALDDAFRELSEATNLLTEYHKDSQNLNNFNSYENLSLENESPKHIKTPPHKNVAATYGDKFMISPVIQNGTTPEQRSIYHLATERRLKKETFLEKLSSRYPVNETMSKETLQLVSRVRELQDQVAGWEVENKIWISERKKLATRIYDLETLLNRSEDVALTILQNHISDVLNPNNSELFEFDETDISIGQNDHILTVPTNFNNPSQALEYVISKGNLIITQYRMLLRVQQLKFNKIYSNNKLTEVTSLPPTQQLQLQQQQHVNYLLSPNENRKLGARCKSVDDGSTNTKITQKNDMLRIKVPPSIIVDSEVLLPQRPVQTSPYKDSPLNNMRNTTKATSPIKSKPSKISDGTLTNAFPRLTKPSESFSYKGKRVSQLKSPRESDLAMSNRQSATTTSPSI